jgi:hypothetical protein
VAGDVGVSRSYIDELALVICGRVPPGKLPDEDTINLFRTYAVLLLAKGEAVTLEDVHNAWSAWMAARDPRHDSLVPFSSLSPDVAEADRPFLEAIRSVAKGLVSDD